MPGRLSQRLFFGTLLAAGWLVPSLARAAAIEIFWDKVQPKGAAGADANKFIPVGDGPFKTTLTGLGLTEIDLATRHAAAATRWDFTGLPADAFNDFQKFGSVGNPMGAVHENSTGKKITDLHIRLLNGDTFKLDNQNKPTSSGGNAFPNVEVKEAGKLIEFSGGNIDKDELLWSKIPKFAQGSAEGKFTDNAPAPKKKQPPKPQPQTGSTTTPMSFIPGGAPDTGTLTIQPSLLNTFLYRDNTVGPKPGEVLNGASITFDSPISITGPSADVPGAFDASDVTFHIGGNADGNYLEGTLTSLLLYPDAGRTTLQGTLTWDYYIGNTDSLILDDFFARATLSDRGFFLYSDLLSLAGPSLSTPVPSLTGTSLIAPVPEPVAPTLIGPLAIPFLARRQRNPHVA